MVTFINPYNGQVFTLNAWFALRAYAVDANVVQIDLDTGGSITVQGTLDEVKAALNQVILA